MGEELRRDHSSFTCTLDCSRTNDGDEMYIGVAALDKAGLAGENPSGQCWVLLPSTGQIWIGQDSLVEPTLSPGKMDVIPNGALGYWDETTKGTEIKALVDPVTRTLSFAVNGGELVDSGVTLPAQVHPYVH